jgi:hypothetical protein
MIKAVNNLLMAFLRAPHRKTISTACGSAMPLKRRGGS